jgi:hypothetical protein
VCADDPGELEAVHLIGRRLTLGHDLPAGVAGDAVGLLRQDATRGAAKFEIGKDCSGRHEAEVLLLREDRSRFVAERGGDDHLEEHVGDPLGRGAVELAVRADDPAECRDGIGVDRGAQRVDERVASCDAAGVRVFDDRDCRLAKRVRDADGGVEVEQVVVGELFPLQLRERALAFADVERGLLLRVLAVAEVLVLLERECEVVSIAEEVGNGRVVGAGLLEHRYGSPEAEGIADLALLELGDEVVVERRIA